MPPSPSSSSSSLANSVPSAFSTTVFSSALAKGLSVAAVKRAKQRTSVTRGFEQSSPWITFSRVREAAFEDSDFLSMESSFSTRE